MIILIGGASGVGKSTVSKNISHELNIIHRIGSGFVREIAKSFISEQENPELYQYSFDSAREGGQFSLFLQSEPLFKPIDACVARADAEGTDLIIEGVNLIPGRVGENVKYKFMLYNSDRDLHEQMVSGETHRQRTVSAKQFAQIRMLSAALVERAKLFGWQTVDVAQVNPAETIIAAVS